MTADRPTKADVERAARAHTKALRMLGVKAPRFAIEKGSQANGIAWRMVAVADVIGMDGQPRTERQRPPIGRDVIGYTAREAYDTVTERTSLLWDMRDAMSEAGYALPAISIVDADPAPSYGTQSACATCGMDIEYHGTDGGWIGRGSDRYCDESGATPKLGPDFKFPHELHRP